MHMIVRVLVNAEDADEALEAAKYVMDDLVGDDRPFDYWTDFVEEKSMVSGVSRWGERPYAQRVHTEKHPFYIMDGRKQVYGAMETNRNAFMYDLKIVREMLSKYTDDQLFEEAKVDGVDYVDSPGFFRHRCHCLGQYQGSQVWLYDSDGSGIRTPRELASILNHEYNDGPLWMVPFDVHY